MEVVLCASYIEALQRECVEHSRDKGVVHIENTSHLC